MDVQIYQTVDGRMRVALDITMQELFRSESFQRDFLRHALDDLSQHVAREAAQIMFGGDLDKLIKEAIREEVKKQVAATVEERLDDVFGED